MQMATPADIASADFKKMKPHVYSKRTKLKLYSPIMVAILKEVPRHLVTIKAHHISPE